MSLSVDPRYGKPSKELTPLDNLEATLAATTSVSELRAVEELAEAAKRYAKTHEQRVAATVAKLKIARRGGQVLRDMAAKGERRVAAQGRPRKASRTERLSDLGLSMSRSSRWQAVGKLADDRFQALIATVEGADPDEDLAGWAPGSGLMSSLTPEWYTPLLVIEKVVAVLGAIDLDPCSNAIGEPRVPAVQHFTAKDNGLDQPWRGRVYMNPPYGKEIGAWVDKLAEEFEHGNVPEAIALVPARTDTSWWAHLPASLVCFVTGRLTFSDHENPAPFPSAVCYLGPNDRRFAQEFISLGLVYVRLETEAAA